MRRIRLSCMAVLCVLVCALPAPADYLSAQASDQGEDQALRQLTTASRLVHHGFYDEAIPRLNKLLSERPTWSRATDVKLQLAMALVEKGDPEQANTACSRLVSDCKQSRPLTAAWAQTSAAEILEVQKKPADAMRAYREVETYLDSLTDMGPVLRARNKAADHFLGSTKFDPNKPDQPELLSFDPSDQKAWLWARSAICARRAFCGVAKEAYSEYEAILASLPAADRRRAILSIDFAVNEILGYDHKNDMDTLVHAQKLIRETEQSFPAEKWLVGKAKITMAEFMLSHNVGLADAERYLREVIAGAEGTNLLPQAYTRLAEVQYVQKRYQEAADTAKHAIESYPYSKWIDFTMYLCADSLRKAGHRDESLAMLERLTKAYPESSWSKCALESKVLWR